MARDPFSAISSCRIASEPKLERQLRQPSVDAGTARVARAAEEDEDVVRKRLDTVLAVDLDGRWPGRRGDGGDVGNERQRAARKRGESRSRRRQRSGRGRRHADGSSLDSSVRCSPQSGKAVRRSASSASISSSTEGSSIVGGTEYSRPAAIARRVARRILPERVFGSRSTTRTVRR